jgi:hypothetical protein
MQRLLSMQSSSARPPGVFAQHSARYSFQALSKTRSGQPGVDFARVPEVKPPVTCLYCGEPIGPGEVATIVTKTSLDESREPDFTSQSVEGIAHPECWERERPEASEA